MSTRQTSAGPVTAYAARRCAAPWCDHPLYGSTRQRFCGTERCDRARAADRQRKHRRADLTAREREQLDDARRAGYVGANAFRPGELEVLKNRICRCNGHHINGGAVGCFKCGLPRPVAVVA